MNSLELAMKIEQEGEIFYRELAERASNPGFKQIFNQLAEDEIKHYQLFGNMPQVPGLFVATEVLKTAGGILRQMVAQEDFQNQDLSQLELYQKAMDLEKKSREFYLTIAAETTDPNQRDLLQKIAAEEEKHYFLIHNIYELMLRPQTWVENGEFVHLEDY